MAEVGDEILENLRRKGNHAGNLFGLLLYFCVVLGKELEKLKRSSIFIVRSRKSDQSQSSPVNNQLFETS